MDRVISVSTDALIDPNTRLVCPVCHIHSADVVVRWLDEGYEGATGNELVTFRCARGDEWTQPTKLQHIFMIGHGTKWDEALEKSRYRRQLNGV